MELHFYMVLDMRLDTGLYLYRVILVFGVRHGVRYSTGHRARYWVRHGVTVRHGG